MLQPLDAACLHVCTSLLRCLLSSLLSCISFGSETLRPQSSGTCSCVGLRLCATTLQPVLQTATVLTNDHLAPGLTAQLVEHPDPSLVPAAPWA